MNLVAKAFKKAAVAAVLSTCLISSLATPTSAAVTESSVTSNNLIGNNLQLQFNVTSNVLNENMITLSWDAAASQKAKKDVNAKKDVGQDVTYYVNPGTEITGGNVAAQTVGVLLEVPAASASAVSSLTVGGVPARSFTVTGSTYYVLQEGLTIGSATLATSGTFNVTFNTTAGAPFSAKLIAVKDNAAPSSVPSDISLSVFHPYWVTAGKTPIPMGIGAKLQYSSTDDVANGVLTIDLSKGINNLILVGNEYGTYSYGSGTAPITAQHYNPVTKVLTLPISSVNSSGIHDIILYNLTYSGAQQFDVTVKMDSDGEGTQFSETEKTMTYSRALS
ncbi:hypothetical protein PAESOLCIP111_03039 [Paenibacillus solanacearum]|uniref:Uncharacterized protein n=1 Tax=Paenibacillus solanacearum TaxID=2048548 RepID=A0A916K2V6_9BACL|nr:hypothetical protein [Paenibacillus solanacearum]CAG7628775.1 hypothetical protein PAESOLCIP111_03039 [Paenibacillus solanacearum]